MSDQMASSSKLFRTNPYAKINEGELKTSFEKKPKERTTLDFLKVHGWQSDYKSVNLMLKRLSRKCKSEASRKTYLSRLYGLCLHTGMNPDKLVALSKKQIENTVQNYADRFNNGKYSLNYANGNLNLLKGFFQASGFTGVRALNLEGYHKPPRYRSRFQYIPTKNEVYAMADSSGSLRNRAFILTEYSTGMRPSTLRASLIRDVKDELSRGISNILIPIYPEMKLIDPYACKGNVPYFVFVCDEATEAIRLYLLERTQKYGQLQGQEPLFSSEYNQISRDERKLKIMSARQAEKIVKDAAKSAGLLKAESITPYCLRKAFETVLHSEAIEGGRLSEKIQEFFMGHILSGSEDAYFDSSKIELLRSEYSKLNFGRVIVENKFKILRSAVLKAFNDTGIDADKVIEEYVEMKRNTISISF